jgi:hypothetical protein
MAKELVAGRFDTDKDANYLRNYMLYCGHLVDEPIKLLELGILKGGSLLLWRDYFDKGVIVGLDINPVSIHGDSSRIFVYQGHQEDPTFLDRIASERAPDGFDIIIDDASHVGDLTRKSFWHLFENHLRPGGIYVIEDWGTGYWRSWPDGHDYLPPEPSSDRRFASHDFGMVGFVKQLIDECGMGDITKPGLGRPTLPARASKFDSMIVTQGSGLCNEKIFLITFDIQSF